MQMEKLELAYKALVAFEKQYVTDLDALTSLYHTLEQADHSILRFPGVAFAICTVLEIKVMHASVLQRLEEGHGSVDVLAQTYANLAQLMDIYTAYSDSYVRVFQMLSTLLPAARHGLDFHLGVPKRHLEQYQAKLEALIGLRCNKSLSASRDEKYLILRLDTAASQTSRLAQSHLAKIHDHQIWRVQQQLGGPSASITVASPGRKLIMEGALLQVDPFEAGGMKHVRHFHLFNNSFFCSKLTSSDAAEGKGPGKEGHTRSRSASSAPPPKKNTSKRLVFELSASLAACNVEPCEAEDERATMSELEVFEGYPIADECGMLLTDSHNQMTLYARCKEERDGWADAFKHTAKAHAALQGEVHGSQPSTVELLLGDDEGKNWRIATRAATIVTVGDMVAGVGSQRKTSTVGGSRKGSAFGLGGLGGGNKAEQETTCWSCATPFTLMRRRYTCKRCNHQVCSSCLTVVDGSPSNSEKVCDSCARKLRPNAGRAFQLTLASRWLSEQASKSGWLTLLRRVDTADGQSLTATNTSNGASSSTAAGGGSTGIRSTGVPPGINTGLSAGKRYWCVCKGAALFVYEGDTGEQAKRPVGNITLSKATELELLTLAGADRMLTSVGEPMLNGKHDSDSRFRKISLSARAARKGSAAVKAAAEQRELDRIVVQIVERHQPKISDKTTPVKPPSRRYSQLTRQSLKMKLEIGADGGVNPTAVLQKNMSYKSGARDDAAAALIADVAHSGQCTGVLVYIDFTFHIADPNFELQTNIKPQHTNKQTHEQTPNRTFGRSKWFGAQSPSNRSMQRRAHSFAAHIAFFPYSSSRWCSRCASRRTSRWI
jgi:hypothetical protein